MSGLPALQKDVESGYKAGGWLKKMFKGIGSVLKVVAPLALSLIPGLGPLIGTAYRWGMAAYHGVKTVTSLTKGRFLEALSHAGSALTGVAGLGVGALSRGAARAKRWLDTGVAYYRQAEAWYQEIKGLSNLRWKR